jgi:mannose-1-phosphate guanylyltransferase
MFNIVLSGGSGTRLWPLSRSALPKQFVKLFDGVSLFQETLRRNRSLCQHTIVISNIEQGNYYWNAGMSCFKAGVFLAELKQHYSEMYEACLVAHSRTHSEQFARKIALADMQAIPEDSIDHAVLEKSSKVSLVSCGMYWSDLGSFDALYHEVARQGMNNDNALLMRHKDAPDPVCVDAHHNLIVARDRQISLVDVDDLLIVDTVDALLIAKKGSSQKIKQVLAQVKQTQPELAQAHYLTHRPWGTYEVLVNAQGYKVKRIVVKPESSLSRQKHFHRNEHWVVVSGTATVTVDEKVFLVRPNESTYIQMGQVHRLENQGKIDLVMIEVQVSEYTGEDDIARLDDEYHRE